MSPTETHFRWPPTKLRGARYEIRIVGRGKNVTLRQDFCEVQLKDCEAGAPYDVKIEVHLGNFVAEYYKGQLQMLDQGKHVVSSFVERRQKYWISWFIGKR